jgi:hypothetical protein
VGRGVGVCVWGGAFKQSVAKYGDRGWGLTAGVLCWAQEGALAAGLSRAKGCTLQQGLVGGT